MSADKPSGRTGVQTLTGKSQTIAGLHTGSMNDGSQQRKIRASVKPQSEPTMKRAVSNSSSSLARNKTICSSYPTGNHGTASIRNEGGETLPSLPYHSHMPFAISQIDSKDSHSFLGPTQQILPSNSRVQSQSYLSGHHHGDSNMLSASRSLPDVMSIKGVVQPKVQGYASHLMENKSIQLHCSHNSEPVKLCPPTQIVPAPAVDIVSSDDMTDIEMPDSGVPPKRGRGRPRKSESEKEKTRVAKLERDKIKRLTKNAQRRSLATQPNHGHPASSQPVPNTGQLSATSHDTHQLRVSVPNNSHSHLERPSCIAAARQNVPEHPKGPAFTSLGGETVPMTSNLSVAQRPLPNRFPAVFDEYNLGLQTFKSNEQEDIFSPISVYPVPNAGNLAAFPVAISPHIILPRQVVTQNTAVDSTLSKRDSPSDPGHQNLGLQTFQQENNFLSVAANRVLNEQDIVTFSAINSPHTVLPGQALTENTAVSRALSNGNLPSGVDTFGLDLQRFQVGEQDNSFLPIAMNPVPNGEDQVAFPAATSVHKVLPQHSQGTPQPASTSSVNPFLPATAPLMQAAPAMRALKYPIQTVEQALSLPGTTNDQEHDQMLATQNRDEKTPEFVFGHGRPRNKKEYRNLSGDMLVKKLYRTEPGLLCDWCSAPGHSDSVGEPRVVADLWERFICNRCATSVLCKIEHANHGNWTPLVLSPHLSSPRCDVCPKGHAVVVCGDCPLRVCTDCQSCLDGTYGTSGDLDQLIDCLQWLGVRDDALVLHSASKDFPRVVTQVPPPTRHLILNRWGDYELVTDADIRADNFLIGVRNPFPSPTPTPEASTGGYDEGELLSHLEF